MGDKGKKDKDKGNKQKQAKQEIKAKEKVNRQQKGGLRQWKHEKIKGDSASAQSKAQR